MAERVTKTVSVDRVEGGTAVLVDASEQINVPASWLPQGAGEGSALRIRIEVDAQAEGDTADRVRRLQSRFKR